MLLRLLFAVLALCFFTVEKDVWAQTTEPTAESEQPAENSRASTGGAQTLEDILARQRGEKIDDSFRRNATGNAGSAASIANQLGTLGGASDAEVYRALRYGSADVSVSSKGPAADIIIQDSGMEWLNFRSGPLIKYGNYLLGGMLVVLILFFLLRGKIRIDGEKTGEKIQRFNGLERFAHWLLAISFIVLGITGILSLIGRQFIIPLIGKDAFATIALACKWVHNSISWAFMLGLVMVFVLWVVHNIPTLTDLKWLAKGGGLFVKGVHPPAKKFNAGQKLIFWAVIILGVSISVSGLALLFPFQLPMFAKTFEIMNSSGLTGLFGMDPLPTVLAPHQEMQLAQLWHSIIAFVFIAIIIAHIYLGSVGMEGAFDAMGSGEVETQWAKEHHSLWYAAERGADATTGRAEAPAE